MSQRGGVLAECAVSIPLLILFIIGILNILNTYSTTIPLSNTSYQLAVVGSDYLPESGEPKIAERALFLLNETNSPLKGISAESFTIRTNYEEDNGLVRVSSGGTAQNIISQLFTSSASYEVAAPILAKRIIISENGNFTSDPLCTNGYNCNLTACSGYGNCLIASNPNGTSSSVTISGSDDGGIEIASMITANLGSSNVPFE